MMKRVIALILALAAMLALASCGQKEQGQETANGEFKTGVLSYMVAASGDQTMAKHVIEAHSTDFQGNGERSLYNNISSALLALNSGEIHFFGTNEATANYIVANNDQFKTVTPTGVIMQTEFSMMTMAEETAVYDMLNDAIVAFKADGTLDRLIETYVNNAGNFDAAVEIPSFEGAETIRVAITGDIPPLDYTTDDGKPAGFNVALLAAIAERAGVNIEPVTMESAARATALASGKVDAIFWVCATICKDHPDVRINESIEADVKITEPYIVLDAAMVCKK